MPETDIATDLKEKVSEEVRLASEGEGRYRVFTPFRFDDGDHLSIVLKRSGRKWIFSDEGHTLMHLSYTISERDLELGNRRKIIERALATFGVKDYDGELLLGVRNNAYGDALFSYVQALLRIADVTYLQREVVKSTFMDDFRLVISSAVPEPKREFDWHDPVTDPDGKYPVDSRVTGNGTPLFVFGVGNDEKCHVATIVIQHYRMTGQRFQSIAVFQDQESVGRKPLARLTDVVDKQFSSLNANRDTIAKYLTDWASHRHTNEG
jgi:hypothetical protein